MEHVTSVCNLADKVIEHYPRLNRDWLIAGAVVHDIGKIEELGTSRRLGYTTRGQLVGHVGLGLEILERHVAQLEGFPVEIKTMLQHLIVSHYGEIDKGALRRPASPEAILLHYLDEVDSRLEQAWRLIDQAPVGEEWTAYVPSLERRLYCSSGLEEELGSPALTDGGAPVGIVTPSSDVQPVRRSKTMGTTKVSHQEWLDGTGHPSGWRGRLSVVSRGLLLNLPLQLGHPSTNGRMACGQNAAHDCSLSIGLHLPLQTSKGASNPCFFSASLRSRKVPSGPAR
jgi:hypothetical protein